MEVIGNERKISRRDFLGISAILSSMAVSVLGIAGSMRFLMPGVFPGPPTSFKIGRPGEFPMNTVSKLPGKNLIIFREEKGLYAISAVCTHLGCIVETSPTGFNCPCHGSRFDRSGRVIGGPAPRPLPWLALSLGPSGHIEVDTKKEVAVGTYLSISESS